MRLQSETRSDEDCVCNRRHGVTKIAFAIGDTKVTEIAFAVGDTKVYFNQLILTTIYEKSGGNYNGF